MGLSAKDDEAKMSKKIAFFLVLFFLLFAACATLRGVAEDAQNLGKGLKKTLSEEEAGARR